ncbi:MAG: hypothetical protein Ct9H300mP28_02080 [Pseudomonadota bacterium]|nr:MAG: hypothetical protein Ct9H300mP28_02080 [Pseudomonadota bacterium]
MYGFWEDEIYWKAQEKYHVNFIRGIVTEITKRGDQVVVKGEDTTMGRPGEVPWMSSSFRWAWNRARGRRRWAQLFQLPSSHGFIESIGGALNTVVTNVPRGLCGGSGGWSGGPGGLCFHGWRSSDEGGRLSS